MLKCQAQYLRLRPAGEQITTLLLSIIAMPWGVKKTSHTITAARKHPNPFQTQQNAYRVHHTPTIGRDRRKRPASNKFHPRLSHSRLLLEPGLADVGTPKLDVEHPLHRGEHLLIGRRGAALKVGDDSGRGVALCGQLALRQGLGLELGARLHDGIADVLADRLGLDDVVGPVDFCEALAFYAGLRDLLRSC